MEKHSVIIFSDGASKGNPGPGGWGAIIASGHRVVELGGREERTTNNRMELTAAICALKEAAKHEGDIVIHTDSSYVIQGITKWVKGWIAKGWITSQKGEVLNRDLWERLWNAVTTLSSERAIVWEHVAGHAGIPGNERVDEIASAFAEGEPLSLYEGSAKEYAIDLTSTSGNRTKKIVGVAAKARSRAKAYSYVSMVNSKIETHETWTECERRVKGVRGAKYKKSLTPEDEASIIASWNALR